MSYSLFYQSTDLVTAVVSQKNESLDTQEVCKEILNGVAPPWRTYYVMTEAHPDVFIVKGYQLRIKTDSLPFYFRKGVKGAFNPPLR